MKNIEKFEEAIRNEVKPLKKNTKKDKTARENRAVFS